MVGDKNLSLTIVEELQYNKNTFKTKYPYTCLHGTCPTQHVNVPLPTTQPISTTEQISFEYSHWRSWHIWAPASHTVSSASLTAETPSADILRSWRWMLETTLTRGTVCSSHCRASDWDKTAKLGAAHAWNRTLLAESHGLAGAPCAKMSCWSGRTGGSLLCSIVCAGHSHAAWVHSLRHFSGKHQNCCCGRGYP